MLPKIEWINPVPGLFVAFIGNRQVGAISDGRIAGCEDPRKRYDPRWRISYHPWEGATTFREFDSLKDARDALLQHIQVSPQRAWLRGQLTKLSYALDARRVALREAFMAWYKNEQRKVRRGLRAKD